MKPNRLQRNSKGLIRGKRPSRKTKRELKERLDHLAEKILREEENIDTLKKERSQLNLSEDNDAE